MRKVQSPLDRPLERKGKTEVSLSAFSFLVSEIVQQAQQRAGRVSDLEERLASLVVRCRRHVRAP